MPTGATWVDDNGPDAVRRPLRVLQLERHAGLHAGLSARDGARTAPKDCHLDVKEGPDHALYFSDETKIFRLAAA